MIKEKKLAPLIFSVLAALTIFFVSAIVEGEAKEVRELELVIDICGPGQQVVGFAKFNKSMTEYEVLKEKRRDVPHFAYNVSLIVSLPPGKYGVTLYNSKFGIIVNYRYVEIEEGKNNKINFCN